MIRFAQLEAWQAHAALRGYLTDSMRGRPTKQSRWVATKDGKFMGFFSQVQGRGELEDGPALLAGPQMSGPWRLVKCQCGNHVCDRWTVEAHGYDGAFYQGCGWPLAQATEIARRLNSTY